MATDNEHQFDESLDNETIVEDESPQQQAPAAAVPSFGLLFQPPTTVTAPPRRRAPEPQPQPELADEDSDEDDVDSRDDSDERNDRDSDERNDSNDSDERNDSNDDDNSQGEGGRRRRRRGGRGRNSNNRSTDSSDDGSSASDNDPSRGNDSSSDDSSSSDDDSSSDSDDSSDEGSGNSNSNSGRNRGRGRGRGRGGNKQDERNDDSDADDTSSEDDSDDSDDSDSDDDGGSSSRRRRRRRRGGSGNGGGNGGGGGKSSQDDPPGTTTRVRESRRDEVQSIKGSTRLEAKKQRRREGRESGRRRTIITEAEFLARRESVERVMAVRQQGERTQIAVLEDGVLAEHYVSRETTSTLVGNVYLGRVQNVLPSMEAAFIDIGKGRNAVLYAGEVNWEAQGVGNGQARRIENAMSAGDSVLVQVTKDPVGHKGARLTSQISLPGRYVVYVPEGSMTGISRKLPDTERTRLKAILKQVVPDSAGVIVRTAAEGASEKELTADVERLTKAWDKVSEAAGSKQVKKGSSGGAPVLLHAEPDMTLRVIRDIFNEDFAKMVVSGEGAWREIKGYVDAVAPDLSDRLEQWTGEGDVFSAHRVDEGISKAMDRKVWLPSGGSLVIDRTEAMTVVDVNTGKFIGSGGNLEETVTKNNLEAAEEIVRQLRLRDIGGIIVVDFIDMVLEANRDLVVRRLLECLGRDRTKHQVAEVTSLGLVQMTRKRVGAGLIEVFSEECDHCQGRGIIVHSEPVAHDPGGHAGGNHGGSSGGGKSRRGRSKGESDSSQQRQEPVEEQTDANGRTAAQIAAAAHAAAIKNISGESSEDDVADLEVPVLAESAVEESTAPEPEAPKRRRGGRRAASSAGAPVALTPVDLTAATTPEPEAAPEPEIAPEPEVSSEPEVAPEPEAPKRRRGGRRAASSAGAPVALEPVDLTAAPTLEPEAAPEPEIAPEPEPAPEPEVAPEPEAPTRRRGGRRAASSAGAPVALQPVDLTAPAETAAVPITKIAGESGEAPTTPVADPEPAAPARPKRKRVTSQAGPPQA
ncbi:ribonuclease [Janibacter sp. Soil728]|uniref:Rne/Rng family ribonuclease n=1 Tax=Janibacter sp. Soil728 TaxID=1736393 RepID=UPI0006F45AAF|nr:Rne/Rng family ribonuclease [Janibacter sp. Soil728]KRE38398.1 ribonuclease [Janibacter sp. Soil728]